MECKLNIMHIMCDGKRTNVEYLQLAADEGAMRTWCKIASELSECEVVVSAVLIPALTEVQADGLLGANSYLWVTCPATQDIASALTRGIDEASWSCSPKSSMMPCTAWHAR